MKKIVFMVGVLFNHWVAAIVYDDFEIKQQIQNLEINQASSAFINAYFTSKNPAEVVDQFLAKDIDPIQKEFVLYELLTTISQQPPQSFFQDFVNRMKTYPITVMRQADGGHSPQALFNINSKAYGIENIWIAYRTEQRINQLFNKDMAQAVNEIKTWLEINSRPAWLGIKNSIAALRAEQQTALVDYLLKEIKTNTGLDRLLGLVGLTTANLPLLEKALQADAKSERETILRKLPLALSAADAQLILMQQATDGPDQAFSTSLLAQFANDPAVQNLLIEKLHSSESASQAAFALSLSADTRLHEQLLKAYWQSSDASTKNHILLSLKLNRSEHAQMLVQDLVSKSPVDASLTDWFKAYNGTSQ